MTTKRFVTVLVGLALCLALCGLPAAAQSAFEREAKDRAEIEKLMWQYARALDTENAEAYAATYAPDGQFGAGANAVKGHDALKKMISDLHQRGQENEAKTGQKRAALYHANTNHYLEFIDKDHARLRAYYMTLRAASGNTPASLVAAGWEQNDLVRLNGKWLIQVRDTAPKD